MGGGFGMPREGGGSVRQAPGPRSLCSGIRTDGFKIALLLRLAPTRRGPRFPLYPRLCGISG